MAHRLKLFKLAQPLAVCRLDPAETVPAWATAGDFWSVTRTPSELAVICGQADVPAGVRAETDWAGLQVQGPLAFEMVGVLAALAVVLAEAGISLLAVSTFDTDILLVRAACLENACLALRGAGHEIVADKNCG